MKKNTVLAIAVVTSALISFGAAAEKKGKAGSGPNPYVNCGIGSALFPDTNWAAVSSNTIWDAGTTAVTSATASPETCNAKSVEAAAFILDTYDNLAEETAKGGGEHIAALLNIFEVDGEARKPILEEVRTGMAAKISSPTYDKLSQIEKASTYYNLVNEAIMNS